MNHKSEKEKEKIVKECIEMVILLNT